MARLRKILNHRYTFWLFLAFVAGWFCLWVLHITTHSWSSLGAPDEGLRYLVPKFIFENGRLPTGYDAATIHTMGNWSYAFYPQFLGAIVSALFMSIVSVFNNTSDVLLYAARMSSVLFGVLTVFFVGKSIKKLLESSKHASLFSYIAMIIVAGWPQVAFLSAYVNNDIVALSGVSMIMYACILGYKDFWNLKNSSLLAVGFVVCLLSYSNSYGFILFGALFFVLSLLWQSKSRVNGLKLVGVVVLLPLIIAGPFFVRNALIYKGDIFGVATFRQETVKWELQTGMKAQHSYSDTGQGLKSLLKNTSYRNAQADSAIARFGKMTIAPRDLYMNIYRYFVFVGLMGFIFMLIHNYVTYSKEVKIFRNPKKVFAQYKYQVLLMLAMIAACMTTITLSLYYSLNIDFQPQGRYIIYLLVPIVIASLLGFKFLIDQVIVKRYRMPLIISLVALYGATSFIIYYKYVFETAVTAMN